MKKLLLALIITLASTGGLPAGAKTPAPTNIVVMENNSDAWVWVAAYDIRGQNNGSAYCVGPGKRESYRHGPPYVYEVRVEVMHQGCSHPVYLDQRLGYPYGYNVTTVTYYVHGKNGRYVYNKTP